MFIEEQTRLHPRPTQSRRKGKNATTLRSTYGSYSNPPRLDREEEDPRPTGSSLVQATSDLLSSMAPSNLASSSEETESRDDAVDLVVKDMEAEELERARERKRGEGGGRRKGVYKVVYRPAPSVHTEEERVGEVEETVVVVEREEERPVVEISSPPPQLQFASHSKSGSNPWT